MQNSKITPKAAFVGFGEVNTPPEFIAPRCKVAAEELAKRGITVMQAPIVNDDPAGNLAAAATAALSKMDFDVLVLCVAGWIPTWAVIRTIEPFKHKPMLLWGLSGWYENGHFVTTADQAGTTALRLPLQQMGYNFKYLVNMKGSEPRYDEAADFIFAAAASANLQNAVAGMCGYRDMRLYGTLYEGTSLKTVIGPEIEHFDLYELQELSDALSVDEVEEKCDYIKANWEFTRQPQPGTVEASVRLALAMRDKINDRKYQAFSFCDVDGVKKLLKFAPAGALTLLHQLVDIPTVPENDSHGAITQMIMHKLTGQVPAYMEFYEFTKDSALMGVPDYVPPCVVDGKVTVMPNAFGSFGEGLLNVSKVRTGKVTLARLALVDGEYVMHATLADAVTPEKWEEAGWAPPAPQLPTLEMKFQYDADEFIQDVMGQHYIVSYGDWLQRLENFCNMKGIALILA
ncbi:MAG: hypothetical protein J5746_12440 [Victivallales bacterium]|nr:hypothetical protein [Victivallales bacterium]